MEKCRDSLDVKYNFSVLKSRNISPRSFFAKTKFLQNSIRLKFCFLMIQYTFTPLHTNKTQRSFLASIIQALLIASQH